MSKANEILTYADLMKQRHTKTTAPLDMEVFAGMLAGKPLSFTDGKITYDIPLSPDVRMLFDGFVELVGGMEKSQIPDLDESKIELLAFKYAKRIYAERHADDPDPSDKEVTKNGD